MDVQKGKRYNNYDLLRCLCLAGVFALHMQRESMFHQAMACLGTMSVSLFFMMSGAFTMTVKAETSLAGWLKKTFHKLIVPWIMAILLYLAEGFAFQYLYTKHIDVNAEINSFLCNGYPTRGWHLWYMYALTEIYLFVPFFKWLKQKNVKIYYLLGGVSWIMAYFLALPWYLKFTGYIGVFIAGDVIFSYGLHLKRIGRIIVCGVMVSSIIGTLLVSVTEMGLLNDRILKIISELSIMLFFLNVHVNLKLYSITRYFLTIYILHIIVGDLWYGIQSILGFNAINAWWMLIVDISIVFGGCYFLCVIGGYIYQRIKGFCKCKAMHLSIR